MSEPPIPRMRILIQRTPDAAFAVVGGVGVVHRPVYIPEPQQRLNRADVLAHFQQVRGERVTARMAGRRLFDHRLDLRTGHDHRQTLRTFRPRNAFDPRQIDAEHVAVQEQQRAQRLILRYAPLCRQRRQERLDLGRAHLARMVLAMEQDESSDPADLRLFGTDAAVAKLGCVSAPGRAGGGVREGAYPYLDLGCIFGNGPRCGSAYRRSGVDYAPAQAFSKKPFRVSTFSWAGKAC